ncbi:MAG: creatininase family protein [Bdellovibrionales bacterium]|nr:creatininase family protein [Bdellovibrionales bacterium]
MNSSSSILTQMDVTGLPFSQLKELFKSDCPLFLYVNPVEYHGPHLSLGNDHHLSVGVAKAFFDRVLGPQNPEWRFLESAPIPMGVDPAVGPGSQFTGFEDLVQAVTEAGRRWAKLGCRRMIVSTFHGAPAHNEAIDRAIINWEKAGVLGINLMAIVLDRAIEETDEEKEKLLEKVSDPKKRDLARDRMDGDFHAGFFETSLAMYFAPETVSKDVAEIPACPKIELTSSQQKVLRGLERMGLNRKAKEMKLAFLGLNWMKVKPFPGYSGYPGAANAEVGKEIFERLLPYYEAEESRVFREGKPRTKPVLGWTTRLTHGLLK